MGVNSKSGPSVFGVHLSMIAPCGMYTNASRVPEFVAACAVIAGIIDSRNGNASVAPALCKNVLRERCFFVMNMTSPLSIALALLGLPHLKRRALHNTDDESRKLVIIAGSVADNAPDNLHIVVLETPAKRVGQKFFGDGSRELFGISCD